MTEETTSSSSEISAPRNFIRDIVEADRASGKNGGRVATRFPPEPNGYLHIGHAKSICLNYGVASEFGGVCNLRFDDTNPTKEEQEYIDAILEDVRWLGFDWTGRLFYASDLFAQMASWAEELIRKGQAYVCDLTADQIRQYRGTLTQPGRPSPYRDRSVDENLDLFTRMRAGEFPDGSRTLRAKIDMASPNLNMRDPVIYRILHAAHPHAGDAWKIYPMYDYAHPLEDAAERITHSICTLEFEDHRPLYDWFLDNLSVPCHPQQIEFARLNLTYTVLSKRKLLQLVERGHVTGWDDPRMPTLSGLRRRGYTPASIRAFCERIGVAKRDSRVDVTLLENAVREDLNAHAPRAMAVLHPLRVVIENYPEGRTEEMEAVNNPEDASMGTRKVPFSRVIHIEQDDFREIPPKKFFRLVPGGEIRLRYAYIIKCESVVKDPATGEIVELRCSYDPESMGDVRRRVKGTAHWVSAAHAASAEVRLYEHLFTKQVPGAPAAAGDPSAAAGGTGGSAAPPRRNDVSAESTAATSERSLRSYAMPSGASPSPDDGPDSPTANREPDADEAADLAEGAAWRTESDWEADLNPRSLITLTGCQVERVLAEAAPGTRWQFERHGYFCVDTKDSKPGAPVFNRTVTLRDTWAKIERKTGSS